VLAEVQAGQAKEAKHAQHTAKLTRQAQEKQAGYQAQMDKLRHKLERSGFKQEVGGRSLLAVLVCASLACCDKRCSVC
jgi:ribosomal protein S4